MKKIFFLLVYVVVLKVSAQVGINTTSPNATLEIKASNSVTPANSDGLLIPKIDAFPLVSPTINQHGMIVYLTTANLGKQPGFYYWNNLLSSWLSISNDANPYWYKVGTTLLPTSINDNMFHNGDIGIGENNPVYKLDVKEISGSRLNVANITHTAPSAGVSTALINASISSGTNNAGILTGLRNTITVNNLNQGIGISNLMNGLSTEAIFGVRNAFMNTGTGSRTGISNNFYSGTGIRIGMSNNFQGSGNQQMGFYNLFEGTPTFASYGGYNRFNDISTMEKCGIYNEFINNLSSNGVNYGTRNDFDGIGSQFKYGLYNSMGGNGDGDFNSVYNNISNTGNGDHIGMKNLFSGTGTGNKYGLLTIIYPSAGGTHYGVYSNVTKSGSYSGYFLGRVAIGLTDADKYILPVSRGTNGQILQTDGVGNVSWQNVNAIVGNNFWTTSGNSGTIAGTNYIGTNDDVNLIFKRSGLVAGKIESQNTSFGVEALLNNTTGIGNTAIGVNALKANINGGNNVAIGSGSLLNNTSGNFNLALHKALTLNTSGSYNLGLGFEALQNNTTASYNLAIGYQSLYDNTVGNFNIGIGATALANNVSGNNNLAIGNTSLNSNVTASFNVALGHNALKFNTLGTGNIAVGMNALEDNTSGSYNIGLGNSTLKDNTTGVENVAIGNYTLQLNTTGNSNTSVGTRSLFYNTTGFSNTALGFNALFENTTGYGNIGIGFSAISNNSIGFRNIGLGNQALNSNIDGDYNIAIGPEALYSNINGNNNIGIGYQAGYNETGSNKLYIENSNSATPLIYGEFDNDLLRMNTQKFLINNPVVNGIQMMIKNSDKYVHSTDVNLDFGNVGGDFLMATAETNAETSGIRGDGDNVTIWSPGDGVRLLRLIDEDAWSDNNGNPYDNNAEKAYIDNAGQYFQVSDANKKQNILKIQNASDKVSQISGYTYSFKLDKAEIAKGDKQIVTAGVLAQEVERILPEAVSKNESGEYHVNYSAITPLLIEALKEQNERIKALEKKIETLEKK